MVTRTLIAVLLFSGLSWASWASSRGGWGLTDLDDTVTSLRAGSAGRGRVFIGGGLRAGK